MKNALLIFLSLAFLSFTTFAQEDSTSTKPKKRFSFSGLPVVAYDADMGFQYGAVGNMYDFGDWSSYPEYKTPLKWKFPALPVTSREGYTVKSFAGLPASGS